VQVITCAYMLNREDKAWSLLMYVLEVLYVMKAVSLQINWSFSFGGLFLQLLQFRVNPTTWDTFCDCLGWFLYKPCAVFVHPIKNNGALKQKSKLLNKRF